MCPGNEDLLSAEVFPLNTNRTMLKSNLDPSAKLDYFSGVASLRGQTPPTQTQPRPGQRQPASDPSHD